MNQRVISSLNVLFDGYVLGLVDVSYIRGAIGLAYSVGLIDSAVFEYLSRAVMVCELRCGNE